MNITTILPVSRTKYLDRVLESLELQTREPDSLLVVFDGPESEFDSVRSIVLGTKFKHKTCVWSTNLKTGATIAERRVNIANIHNQIRSILPKPENFITTDHEPDWVFSVEDDGILPPDALAKLWNVVKSNRNVGMVTGVELGRWGVPYVGAWTVNDVENPTLVTSLESKAKEPEIEEIDACGLYCALIRQDFYSRHEFFTSNGLGPDVNLGIFLRKLSLKNYIDWSVHVTHLTSDFGLEIEIPATDNSRVVKLTHQSGNIWLASR